MKSAPSHVQAYTFMRHGWKMKTISVTCFREWRHVLPSEVQSLFCAALNGLIKHAMVPAPGFRGTTTAWRFTHTWVHEAKRGVSTLCWRTIPLWLQPHTVDGWSQLWFISSLWSWYWYGSSVVACFGIIRRQKTLPSAVPSLPEELRSSWLEETNCGQTTVNRSEVNL